MLKKILILFIGILFLCTSCGKNVEEDSSKGLQTILGRGYVVVGVKTDSYPFGFKDRNGNFAGFDIELSKLIAKGILGDKNKVKFVQVTSSDRIMKLYSEEVDMLVATMSVTSKRKELLDFSTSYHTAGQSILVKHNSNINGLRDLNGKRVIIVLGSTSEKSLKSSIPQVQIVGCKNYSEAYQKLKSGKAEAIVSDDTILLGMSLKDNSLRLISKKYTKEPYAVAFRKGVESQDLLAKVNEIVDLETRNGTMKKLKNTFKIK